MEAGEWLYRFTEGEEPSVLTGVSSVCHDGKHADCPGYADSQEHVGQTVFCICPCHEVPAEA